MAAKLHANKYILTYSDALCKDEVAKLQTYADIPEKFGSILPKDLVRLGRYIPLVREIRCPELLWASSHRTLGGPDEFRIYKGLEITKPNARPDR